MLEKPGHFWISATTQRDRPKIIQQCKKCNLKRERLPDRPAWSYLIQVGNNVEVWPNAPHCIDEPDVPDLGLRILELLDELRNVVERLLRERDGQ